MTRCYLVNLCIIITLLFRLCVSASLSIVIVSLIALLSSTTTCITCLSTVATVDTFFPSTSHLLFHLLSSSSSPSSSCLLLPLPPVKSFTFRVIGLFVTCHKEHTPEIPKRKCLVSVQPEQTKTKVEGAE